MSCLEFNVLYTHHKARKSKIWQDGILKMSSGGNKADLFDAQGKHLECVFLKGHKVEPGGDLESDRFLIMVENEKFTEYNSNDKPKKKASPKTDKHDLKTFGLHLLHKPIGLKRKSTGFQGPRKVPKKAADEVHAPAISSPTKQSYISPPPFYAASSLFSMVCRKDTEINLPSTSKNAAWRNSVIPSQRPGMLASSVLSASSMHSLKKVEDEKCTHSITVDVAEKLKGKVPAPYSIGDSPSTSGVTVSQSIRSRAKILALLKSNTLAAIEEKSLRIVQDHYGDQSRNSMNALSEEKCIAKDGYPQIVVEEGSEHIQQQHPLSSLSMKSNMSRSKWDIYLPQKLTDPSCDIRGEEKNQEEGCCLQLGRQERYSQGGIYIFAKDGASNDRLVENQPGFKDQNAAPLFSTPYRSDGAVYTSAGGQHVSRDKENERQISKYTEITNLSSSEGSNYSASCKEFYIMQKNTQNGSKTRLANSMKETNVSFAAFTRMPLESLGDGTMSAAHNIASAGTAMKDTLTISDDFGDSLQHFAGITFNLLDNFDFGNSEEDRLQESSSLPTSSADLLKKSVVKNGVRSPEEMASSQEKSSPISDMPPALNSYVCESPVNSEVMFDDNISMGMDRFVKYGSPVPFLDLKPSKSEHTKQHRNANAENMQSTDDNRNFDLFQVSGVKNSLKVNNELSSVSEHKGITNHEFHPQIERSRETEVLLHSPVCVCTALVDVPEKSVRVHKEVQSQDSSLSYRGLNITSDGPLLNVSLKNGTENFCTLINDKPFTMPSKLDKEDNDPYVFKALSPSLGRQYLSEEMEACASLFCTTSSISGHKYETSGANCRKSWANADTSLGLSDLVNGMSFLKDLTEHSTALESLETLSRENTDLLSYTWH